MRVRIPNLTADDADQLARQLERTPRVRVPRMREHDHQTTRRARRERHAA